MTSGLIRCGAMVLLCCATAFAQPETPVDYTGHKLVEVQLDTVDDLNQMLQISPDHWSCSPHLGTVPFRVAPQDMPQLDASGLSYRVIADDVQKLLERYKPSGPQVTDGSWFDVYHPYSEVSDYVTQLANLRPDLATRISLGFSLENREIFGLRVTGPSAPADRPAVLFNACQHAREWVSVTMPMYIGERLIMDYDSDPVVKALVDTTVFYLVPIVNPDGYVYSWGPDRLWRKNRRNNGGGAFGVDNNRNWGYQWGLNSGSSGDPFSETYRGTAPFSEPETQVMRDFIQARPEIQAHIDFHSYSQLILSPFGYAEVEPSEPLASTFDFLNGVMQQAIADQSGEFYAAGPIGSTLYLASGGAVDWVFGDQGILSWTIELRPDSPDPGFLLPESGILPTVMENFAAVTRLAQYVGQFLISFPEGRPAYGGANAPTSLSVAIVGDAQTVASGTVWYRTGNGAFQAAPLSPAGVNLFTATIPGQPAGFVVEYYLEAVAESGLVVREPAAGTYAFPIAVLADTMETDSGWIAGAADDTASTGLWNRGDPVGTSAQPPDDHTPGGTLCWVTGSSSTGQAGSNDVDGGKTTLRSPAYDLSGLSGPRMGYWRWYSNAFGGAPGADTFVVDISNDGVSWVNVETVGPSGPQTAGGWFYHEFVVSDFVTPGASVQLRFVASDLGAGSLVEALVDDFVILADPPATCPGDLNGDGQRDQQDLNLLLAGFGCTGGGCGGDVNGDGATDQADLNLLLSEYGVACP